MNPQDALGRTREVAGSDREVPRGIADLHVAPVDEAREASVRRFHKDVHSS